MQRFPVYSIVTQALLSFFFSEINENKDEFAEKLQTFFDKRASS